jgi:hypothetical protein
VIFSLVVLGVGISVVITYVRHGRFMRRKRAAELAAGTAPAQAPHDDAQ